MSPSFVVCMILLFLNKYLAVDPCVDYSKLNDPDRSAAFATTGTSKCDSAIKEGWYRSVSGAGSDIPTAAVPTQRCGTSFPIWMDDTVPGINTEKNVKLCVSHFTGHCASDFIIKIKNCGEFNVYELKQTSSCPMRYCFGTHLKCPDGQSSANGFYPGCETVPNTTLSLFVVTGITDGTLASPTLYHKAVKFECKMKTEPENINDLLCRVQWFIEDNLVSTFDNTTCAGLAGTYLSEEKWVDTYTMGFNVKCTMRVKHTTGTVYGPVFQSEFFYAGFKVDNSELFLKEKETKEIKIWLTVPVGCLRPASHNNDSCFINIRVWNPQYQIDQLQSPSGNCPANGFQGGSILFKKQDCGVHFQHESWDTVKTITVIGQSDSLYNTDSSRLTYIRIQAEESPFPPKTWNSASIPDIKVYVADSDIITLNKKCQSNNDPHMVTFDLKSFEHHVAGTFIMVKHKTLPIMIQATYTGCGGNTVTCNCGVAIQNYNALFIGNFCGAISYTAGGPRNNHVARYNCDDKYMRITHSRNIYTIKLPTGMTVVFSTWSSGIHYIHIKPSVDDLKQSSGLCGYFDGDTSNDFTLRDGTTTTDSRIFAEDWRVKGTDINLFDHNLNLPPNLIPLREYCVCNDTSTGQALVESSDILCNLHSAMIPCKNTDVNANTASGFFKICGKSRTRRDVYSHHITKRETEEEEDDVFDVIPLTYPLDYQNLPNITLTWRNGWNEVSARKTCKEYIENRKVITICNTLIPQFDTDTNRTIEECVSDIKLTGNTSYMETSLSALSSGCVMEAKKFENLTTSNSTSGNSSKTLLDDILEESCLPSNCSGHGYCVKGECECFDDFFGYHCNLRRSTAPSINKDSNTGLCKTEKKSCRSYGIVGTNMIRGSLKCRARHFKLYDNKTTEVNDTVLEFNGTYVNEFSCVCTVPDSRRRRAANPATVIADGYHISVSNDGINYSDEITFINYDSTCYECNTTATTCSVLDTCPLFTTTTEAITTTTTVPTESTTTAETTTTTLSKTTTTTTVETTTTKEATTQAKITTAAETTTTTTPLQATTTTVAKPATTPVGTTTITAKITTTTTPLQTTTTTTQAKTTTPAKTTSTTESTTTTAPLQTTTTTTKTPVGTTTITTKITTTTTPLQTTTTTTQAKTKTPAKTTSTTESTTITTPLQTTTTTTTPVETTTTTKLTTTTAPLQTTTLTTQAKATTPAETTTTATITTTSTPLQSTTTSTPLQATTTTTQANTPTPTEAITTTTLKPTTTKTTRMTTQSEFTPSTTLVETERTTVKTSTTSPVKPTTAAATIEKEMTTVITTSSDLQESKPLTSSDLGIFIGTLIAIVIAIIIVAIAVTYIMKKKTASEPDLRSVRSERRFSLRYQNDYLTPSYMPTMYNKNGQRPSITPSSWSFE